MIVHVFPSYPAGSGRSLGTYILDLKHEHKGEWLGPYVDDSEKHKVEWSRTVNTNADSPAAAIAAIELYNAQNLHWHSKSRMVHFVVSFPEGEKPIREQAEAIEDRLMAAIGFGDHPRISALHKPDGREVDNWHIHIATSRIDPTTLKAEHPRHDHFKLQAEAARLEIELGLTQERKTLLPRERQEIEIQRKFDGRALEEFEGQKEEKMADDTDLRASQAFPLTRGEQQDIAIGGPDVAVLSQLGRDDAQSASQPKLWDRYQQEKEIALASRQEAVQEVYDKFSEHRSNLRQFYTVQHEKEKLELRRGLEHRREHEILKAQQGHDRVEAQQQRSRQLAAARAQNPVPSWDKFLERESQAGNKEAQKILEQRRERGRSAELER